MIKRFLLLLVLVFPVFGMEYQDKSKPVIYFLNQNPISAYYGNAAASYISHRSTKYRVYSFYLKMDFGKSVGHKRFLIDSVIDDIKRIDPEIIVVHGSGLSKEVRAAFPKKKVMEFSFSVTGSDFHEDNPVSRLISFTKALNFDPSKFFIMDDGSLKGKRASEIYKDAILKAGIPEKQIQTISVRSVQELESKLRVLNRHDKGVIINCMYELADDEHTNHKLVVDIKKTLVRYNRTHLDVGGYRFGDSNEAIILQLDYAGIGAFLDGTAKTARLKTRLYANIHRMETLGFRPVQAVEHIDEIVK